MKIDVFIVQDKNKEVVGGFPSSYKAGEFIEQHKDYSMQRIKFDLDKKFVQRIPTIVKEEKIIFQDRPRYLGIQVEELMKENPEIQSLKQMEFRQIRLVLNQVCGGNKTNASKILGITVKTLYNKIEAFRKEGMYVLEGAV